MKFLFQKKYRQKMKHDIKILIVEDEILIADFIFDMLKKEKFCNIQVAHNISTTLHKFKTFQPEIVLMDINVEGENTGIELATKKNEDAKVIYITAQNDIETIEKAIATNPETYLTKPLKKADLLAAIQIASNKTTKKYTIIKDGYNKVKLTHDDIIYIKSENNYIDIFTTTRKYTLRNSLDNFLSELNNNIFCKTHRSYVVNKNKITKKTAQSVILCDIEIPVSRNYQIDF